MKRTMIGAVFVATLLGSAAFAAGTSTPSSSTPPPDAAPSTAPMTAPSKPAKPDYAAECKELATQWETAEAANATNAKLGKAKAKAGSAEKNCASTKASKQKTGVSQYKAALKLLGVKPTT